MTETEKEEGGSCLPCPFEVLGFAPLESNVLAISVLPRLQAYIRGGMPVSPLALRLGSAPVPSRTLWDIKHSICSRKK